MRDVRKLFRMKKENKAIVFGEKIILKTKVKVIQKLVEEDINKIIANLKEIINNVKKSDTWKI